MKALTALVFLCLLSQAPGAPIQYTYSGTGSGRFGSAPFTDAHFLIIASADTQDFSRVDAFVSQILLQSATVQVDGFVLGQFEIGLRLFQAPYYSVPPGSLGDATVGLSLASGPDLLNLFHHAFVGYDLVSNLGPVFVPVPDYQSRLSFSNIPTSVGPMTLSSSRNVTFTASLVPEPAPIFIFGAGMALMGLVTRKRDFITALL